MSSVSESAESLRWRWIGCMMERGSWRAPHLACSTLLLFVWSFARMRAQRARRTSPHGCENRCVFVTR